MEMLLGLLVMSQFPILVAPPLPPSEAVEDEFEEPQAARAAVAATALISPRERLRRMRVTSFRVRGGRVAWGHSGRPEGWSQGPHAIRDTGAASRADWTGAA